MESVFSIWWVICLVPVLLVGIFFAFFPHKVIQFRAMLQQHMFKAFNMKEEEIDSSLFSILFRERYSQRLKRQIETPKKSNFLMVWIRIIGFFALLLFTIILLLFIVAPLE